MNSKKLDKFDKQLDTLIDKKRTALDTILKEKLKKDIMPRLKNWKVFVYEGWWGVQIILQRKGKRREIPFNTSIYSDTDCTDRFDICQELCDLCEFATDNSSLGNQDFNIEEILIEGENYNG